MCRSCVGAKNRFPLRGVHDLLGIQTRHCMWSLARALAYWVHSAYLLNEQGRRTRGKVLQELTRGIQMLTQGRNQRRRREGDHGYLHHRVSLGSECGSPTASASCPLANGGKMVYMHPSYGGEECPSLPMRNRYSSGVAWKSHNAHA